MKKFLTALMMAACIFGLTACGSEDAAVTYNEDNVKSLCQGIYQMIDSEYTDEAMEEIQDYDDYEWEQIEANWRNSGGLKVSGDVIVGAIQSWKASKAEVGETEGIESYEITADDENVYAIATVKGSEHDAEIEFVFNHKLSVESITVSVDYSFGELMWKALLNTLLGMGTVFSVLILISLIISCFKLIPKMQASFSKKQTEEEVKTVAVDQTIAQIIEKEELADDNELIAVIAAAIAASEGAVSTEGFVVRSIKRANRRIR